MGVTTQCITWTKYGSEHNLLPQHGSQPMAKADPEFTKKVKRGSAITLTKNFTVKVTLRSAASPCQALFGHLVDGHSGFTWYILGTHYSRITLFVDMGTCILHIMSPFWGTCSAMCPLNVW